MSNDKKEEKVVKMIVSLLLVIWLFVVFVLFPLRVAIGMLNGDSDTLEPKAYESVHEQIKSEQLIQ